MPKRMYFGKPDKLEIGDLVWYFRSDVLFGPLLIIDQRKSGYGGNGQPLWIMHDTTTGDYHQARTIWLRVPKECV